MITQAQLDALQPAFSALYQGGLAQVESQYTQFATVAPSSGASNVYGWLGQMPNLRKWVGPRELRQLQQHSYTIENEDFEETVIVQRNHIKDDQLGMYNMMFTELGRAVAAHPDQMCASALQSGWSEICYDGQNFFDTDHPVIGKDGEVSTVSNTQTGTGPAWFLMDDTRAVKPIIYQEREPFNMQSMDSPNDQHVFMNKEFIYGVDGRNAVGYGFWQMIIGSKQPLTPENYKAARTALRGMTGDHVRPLGLKGTLLMVSGSLEDDALELLNTDRNASGATNKYKGTAKLLVSDWLDAEAA